LTPAHKNAGTAPWRQKLVINHDAIVCRAPDEGEQQLLLDKLINWVRARKHPAPPEIRIRSFTNWRFRYVRGFVRRHRFNVCLQGLRVGHSELHCF